MSPIPVSFTRPGYPSFHRRMMYVKDEKANPKSTSEDFSPYQKVRGLKSSFTSSPYEISSLKGYLSISIKKQSHSTHIKSRERLPGKEVKERSNFDVPSSRIRYLKKNCNHHERKSRQQLLNPIHICCRKEKEF
ncbi:hypothetical protein M9H77_02895 [Catharanthus roseus]|uniref:Uncharacterized protein n=1 Tax=Catharanthus roseus TaxID=4058 RepID=A0ACC0C9P4_CATRO|nr:hypothetical protein M9H77_02895 [Catharanthus roseus]